MHALVRTLHRHTQPTACRARFACAIHSAAASSLSRPAMHLHCKGLERRALHVLNLACRACVLRSFGCRSSSPASTLRVCKPLVQAACSSRLLKRQATRSTSSRSLDLEPPAQDARSRRSCNSITPLDLGTPLDHAAARSTHRSLIQAAHSNRSRSGIRRVILLCSACLVSLYYYLIQLCACYYCAVFKRYYSHIHLVAP